MTKVCIINGGYQYEKMFTDRGFTLVQNFKEAELIQFTGGADVSPCFYGELNTDSHCDKKRDLREQELFFYCLEHKIPMAGICRGGQFLNVMNCGKMQQDVPNHCKSHKAYDLVEENCTYKYMEVIEDEWGVNDIPKFVKEETAPIIVTSTHHQIMIPHTNAEILLVALERFNLIEDYEAVWYENSKSLCFQPHPEFGTGECQDLYFKYIEKFIL